MEKLTLNIDSELLGKIEIQAKKENVSVSRWVSQKLALLLNRSWSARFLQLAGSLKEDDLHKQDHYSKSKDVRLASI